MRMGKEGVWICRRRFGGLSDKLLWGLEGVRAGGLQVWLEMCRGLDWIVVCEDA